MTPEPITGVTPLGGLIAQPITGVTPVAPVTVIAATPEDGFPTFTPTAASRLRSGPLPSTRSFIGADFAVLYPPVNGGTDGDLQAAIDRGNTRAQQSQPYRIYLLEGQFPLRQTQVIGGNLAIYGRGAQLTAIQQTGTPNEMNGMFAVPPNGIFEVRHVTLRNGVARTAANSGGAIYGQGQAVIRIYDSIIRDNQATNYGGGLVASNSQTVIIERSVFLNNIADNAGGAIYSTVPLNVTCVEFSTNGAGREGGAIAHVGRTPWPTPLSNTFYRNYLYNPLRTPIQTPPIATPTGTPTIQHIHSGSAVLRPSGSYWEPPLAGAHTVNVTPTAPSANPPNCPMQPPVALPVQLHTNLLYDSNFDYPIQTYWAPFGDHEAGSPNTNSVNNTVNPPNRWLEMWRRETLVDTGIFQYNPNLAPADAELEFNFQIGNRSPYRRTVSMVVRKPDWTEVHVCYIGFIPAFTPLTSLTMRFRATTEWPDIVVQAYVSVTTQERFPAVRFDNFDLQIKPEIDVPSSNIQCPTFPQPTSDAHPNAAGLRTTEYAYIGLPSRSFERYPFEASELSGSQRLSLQGFGPTTFAFEQIAQGTYQETHGMHPGIDYGRQTVWSQEIMRSLCDGVVVPGRNSNFSGTLGSINSGRGISVRCFMNALSNTRVDTDGDGIPNLSNVVIVYNHIGLDDPIPAGDEDIFVQIGQIVTAGAMLGRTGTALNNSYDHLDFQVWLARGGFPRGVTPVLLNPLLMYSWTMVGNHSSQHDFQTYYPQISGGSQDNSTYGINRGQLFLWTPGGTDPNQGAAQSFWNAQIPQPVGTVEWPTSIYPLNSVSSNPALEAGELELYVSNLYFNNPYIPTNCAISQGFAVPGQCNY